MFSCEMMHTGFLKNTHQASSIPICCCYRHVIISKWFEYTGTDVYSLKIIHATGIFMNYMVFLFFIFDFVCVESRQMFIKCSVLSPSAPCRPRTVMIRRWMQKPGVVNGVWHTTRQAVFLGFFSQDSWLSASTCHFCRIFYCLLSIAGYYVR